MTGWPKRAVATAAMAGATSLALAQTTPIYRCGNAYSQWPCSSAPPLVVVDAAPSATEQAVSARTAAAQARSADRMRAERLAAESRTHPALAGSLGPAPTTTPSTQRPRYPAQHRHRQSLQLDTDGDFIAHVPAPPRHRSTAK